VYSTDLTEGNFNSRKYAKFSLVPSIDFAQTSNRTISASAGATLDTSNRDSTELSPQLGLLLHTKGAAHSTYYEIEYASTSQLPGYTALNSRPAGLFGGNSDLGRETARQFSIAIRRQAWDWSGSLTLFHRKDDNLVDWTYFTEAPFSRQANPVDLDVSGLEVIVTRQWKSLDLVAGYTYLDKDSDYGGNDVDASFYALNFAQHRATLALRYQLTTQLELRLDNEYRVQEDNPLRTSDDKSYLASLALVWMPANIRALAFTLTADNLTDSDYQYFPGTPAVGRQLSMSAAYSW
jgi:vitamin B12 transporter